MEDNKPKVIIVGSGAMGKDSALLALKVAELREQHPDLMVITNDNFDETFKDGVYKVEETFQFKAPLPLPELQPIIVNDNFYIDGRSARNKRREANRKSKKRRF